LAYWLPSLRLRTEARPLPRIPNAEIRRLETTRARLRLALVATLAVAGVLAFIVFPPRELLVSADGKVITVVSRQQDIATLLGSAGVDRDPGDVFVVSSNAITVERAIPVVVEADGVTMSWRTRAISVEGLLRELRIDVSPHDAIYYNGLRVAATDPVYPRPINTSSLASYGIYNETPGDVQGIILDIKRAVPVTVVEDGRSVTLQTSVETVNDALTEAGISLGPADKVFPPVATTLNSGMQIEVSHAKAINLRLGDQTQVIYSQAETLEEALLEAGYTFGPEDRVEPALSVAVTNDMEARIVRVVGQPFFEREDVVHKTVFKPDDSLTGIDTVRTEGHDGVRIAEYKIVIEDGVETERTYVGESYDPEPEDTVIYYSASAINSTGSAEDLQVAETMSMYATWYNAASSGKPATHPAYGITRSGAPLTKGIVAVDPSVIPLGTKLFIPGYGFAVAGDTGGGIIGDAIDLGYPDGVAVDWRTGWVDVYILQ
jgi:resuscitation-promoting factor RpfB